jgi:hypothetical protein
MQEVKMVFGGAGNAGSGGDNNNDGYVRGDNPTE